MSQQPIIEATPRSRRRDRAIAAIVSVLGPDECAIYAALLLLAGGCWLVSHAAAFIAPAVVMLWMYLPARGPFVVALTDDPPRKAKD